MYYTLFIHTMEHIKSLLLSPEETDKLVAECRRLMRGWGGDGVIHGKFVPQEVNGGTLLELEAVQDDALPNLEDLMAVERTPSAFICLEHDSFYVQLCVAVPA